MRLFDRYILSRIIVGTVVGVLCLSIVLLLGQLFKDIKPLIIDQQAPLRKIAQFLWSSVPFMLTFTLPWAFLSAVVLAFGKLSSTNELIGMRLAGWGVWRLAAPVALVGALLSTLCMWLNGTAAPQAQHDIRTLLFEAVREDPQSFLSPGTAQKRMGDDSRLYVEEKEGARLKGFHFFQLSEETPFPTSYVYAREVGVSVAPDQDSLSLDLRQAYIENQSQTTPFLIADQAQPWIIQLPDQKKRKKTSGKTNAELKEEMKTRTDERFQMSATKEIAKRRSLAMACFCLGLIGVPLGMSSKRQDTNSGFLKALGVAGLYFGLIIAFEGVGDTQALKRFFIWLPNLLCLVVIAFLFRKASFA